MLIDFIILYTTLFYDIIQKQQINIYNWEVTIVEITNRWYSLKEICEYFGVSRDTVFKWIDSKNMPAHKMGRQWKFKLDEVDNWIKSGASADWCCLRRRAIYIYMGLFSKLFKKKKTAVSIVTDNMTFESPEYQSLWDLKVYMDAILSQNRYIA